MLTNDLNTASWVIGPDTSLYPKNSLVFLGFTSSSNAKVLIDAKIQYMLAVIAVVCVLAE